MLTFHVKKMMESTIGEDYTEDAKYYVEGACLSTDDKPVTGIYNGSRLMEIDTSKRYMFDADGAEGSEWVEVYAEASAPAS